MPLCSDSEVVALTRGCGYQNECGVIWFSLLMRQGTATQESLERMMEYHTNRTITRMDPFEKQKHYLWHESLYAVVSCRCAKYVGLRTGRGIILNVIVRVQARLQLSDPEKEEFLRVLSRRLFYGQESQLEKYRPQVDYRHKTDFVFLRTGMLLENSIAFKLALQTVSYEVSTTKVPRDLPFLPHPVLFLGACRTNVVATVILKTSGKGSPVTQPVMTRSMLREMADPAVWPIASKGLCYIPAFRTATYREVEEWVLHVHGTYCDHHPESPCPGCPLKQPLPLQCIAQLSYLRNCMSKRRARVEGDRKSPFFY
ncbi:ORF20 [Aviadenovirus cerasi]|uniref:ORF20 n=1 Tax=Fowl aviadenovirus 5 TaxID=172861 RepID=A0A6M3Z5M5_9ADEN|nr:ORF20 [Fowl aviadenovirus 5]